MVHPHFVGRLVALAAATLMLVTSFSSTRAWAGDNPFELPPGAPPPPEPISQWMQEAIGDYRRCMLDEIDCRDFVRQVLERARNRSPMGFLPEELTALEEAAQALRLTEREMARAMMRMRYLSNHLYPRPIPRMPPMGPRPPGPLSGALLAILLTNRDINASFVDFALRVLNLPDDQTEAAMTLLNTVGSLMTAGFGLSWGTNANGDLYVHVSVPPELNGGETDGYDINLMNIFSARAVADGRRLLADAYQQQDQVGLVQDVRDGTRAAVDWLRSPPSPAPMPPPPASPDMEWWCECDYSVAFYTNVLDRIFNARNCNRNRDSDPLGTWPEGVAYFSNVTSCEPGWGPSNDQTALAECRGLLANAGNYGEGLSSAQYRYTNCRWQQYAVPSATPAPTPTPSNLVVTPAQSRIDLRVGSGVDSQRGRDTTVDLWR